MKTSKSMLSAGGFLLNPLLVLFLFPVVTGGDRASCQEKKVLKPARTVTVEKNTVTLVTKEYADIPEATEPCAPEQCEWWDQLRRAGNDLQRKGDEKSKKRFALLFAEGLQKGYRIPLKDRPPQMLAERRPHSDPSRTGKINGKVMLSVEYGADGSVGDVKVVAGLGSAVDEGCVQAAHQRIFLPAIRDGAFAAYRSTVTYKFWSRL